MGWRFRTSFKVIPGVRLNLSKSGLSASIGGAPLTLNIGQRGVYGTASLPGTGLSVRHRFGGQAELSPNASTGFLPSTPALPQSVATAPSPIEEVKSASTELLTSESLKE